MDLREILSWAGYIFLWLAYPLLWVSGYLKGRKDGIREAMREYNSAEIWQKGD